MLKMLGATIQCNAKEKVRKTEGKNVYGNSEPVELSKHPTWELEWFHISFDFL